MTAHEDAQELTDPFEAFEQALLAYGFYVETAAEIVAAARSGITLAFGGPSKLAPIRLDIYETWELRKLLTGETDPEAYIKGNTARPEADQ